MRIGILTFQGVNELDSLIALGVLNRIKKPTWRVTLCCPEVTVASMNGVMAAWIIARTEGTEAARSALHYVAPVGEKEENVARAMKNMDPFLPPQ